MPVWLYVLICIKLSMIGMTSFIELYTKIGEFGGILPPTNINVSATAGIHA